MVQWKVQKTEANVAVVSVFLESSNDVFSLLARSDAHHDNPDADNELELKHLKEAKKINAGIIDCGDNFCAMQGKYDPRSTKGKIKPEHMSGDYLDRLVVTNAEFLSPFANNFICLGRGNHETAIANRYETDLTQRMADLIGQNTGKTVHVLGYTGWVIFRFYIKTRIKPISSKVLWFTHGYGGGGPVTQDMTQAARQKAYILADILMSGHVHYSWVQEFIRHSASQAGRIHYRLGYYVKLPSYKNAYGAGVGGFEVEKGHGPRPIGAYWINFKPTKIGGTNDMNISIIKAE